MAQKLCIYCKKIVLEGFDETERKYYEKGSKTVHTRERCEAAKTGPGPQTNTNNNQDLADLNKKVDQLLVLVTQLHDRLSGHASIDMER
jgi:hypothetical protein